MKHNEFPKGWDVERVQRILAVYEPKLNKPVFNPMGKNLMEIPKELVPAIRELIARYKAM